LTFNNDIRNNISDEKLKNFYEVADLISERVSNRKIYNKNEGLNKFSNKEHE
jgi:hypothetical protein